MGLPAGFEPASHGLENLGSSSEREVVATDGIDPSSCAYEAPALPLSYAAAVVLRVRIARFFLGSQPSVSLLHLSQHIWGLPRDSNAHFQSSYRSHRS